MSLNIYTRKKVLEKKKAKKNEHKSLKLKFKM